MVQQFVIVAVFVLYPTSLLAQFEVDDELAGSINRMGSTMQLVLDESERPNSKLELVGEQKAQLAELAKNFKQMILELNELDGDKDGIESSVALFFKKMDQFESTLHKDILLPHQSQALKAMVFAEFVRGNGGSMLRAISKYYSREFDLKDAQKKKLIVIEKRAANQVAEAKKRFKKELEKIAKKTNEDVRSVLTSKQEKALEELRDSD